MQTPSSRTKPVLQSTQVSRPAATLEKAQFATLGDCGETQLVPSALGDALPIHLAHLRPSELQALQPGMAVKPCKQLFSIQLFVARSTLYPGSQPTHLRGSEKSVKVFPQSVQ